MGSHDFLVLSLILLGAAMIAVPLFKRLGLGSVLGYLAAGAVLGPFGVGVVQDAESIRHFAEIGVVLLMFVIGLELLPRRLWEMRRQVFGLGGAQVVGTGLLLAAAAAAVWGVSARGAVVAGLGLALSSTAFAMQALAERNQLTTRHGRDAFAILLFQDLAVIPLLAILPLLAPAPAAPTSAVETAVPGWVAAAKGMGMLVAVIAGGRYLLRPIFRVVAGARSQEALTATVLALVVGVALLMDAVGLSMAFGAFLAGVLLADSEYRHELEADIEPFKGLLLGLFFMAVGMSVSFGLVAARPVTLIGLAVGLCACKIAVTYAIARAVRTPTPGARTLAVAISQGGEFAFVLFAAAAEKNILPRGTAEALVVIVTLSMAATPFGLALVDRCERRRAATRPGAEGEAPPHEESGVIIAGFGRFGQIVGRVLSVRNVGFTALDRDSEHIQFVARFGAKAYFGDVTRLDLLRAARADKARVLVLAIDEVEASMKTVQLAKQHFPQLRIFARARNRGHAYRLLDAGVEVVSRETFRSSLDVAREVLTAVGLPDAIASDTVRVFGEHDEEMVRRAAAHHQDTAKLIEIATHGRRELQSLFDQDTDKN